MVEPAAGALNHTSSEPEVGAGVAVVGVGVGLGVGEGLGVGDGLGVGEGLGVGVTVFCTFTLMTSIFVWPLVPVTVAFSWCAPFANLVVSRTHCMPSLGVLSVLSAVESIVNATLL